MGGQWRERERLEKEEGNRERKDVLEEGKLLSFYATNISTHIYVCVYVIGII